MLKLLNVILLVTMFVTGTIHGQTLSKSSAESQANLRQAILRETEKIKNESAAFDPSKIDKMQHQAQKKKTWSTKNTLIVTVVVGALVGLAIILALNSKRCIKRNPPSCSFVDDADCQCLEYAQ